MATFSDGITTWTYTYNADGLRTKRTNGTTTYNYVYNGSKLTQLTVGANTLYISYDANGRPFTVTFNGTVYYYVLNMLGDVIGIANSSGTLVVSYLYDAWGYAESCTGTMAATLGKLNPLRYRSYVYDEETKWYYLQSRYYNPEVGRFINADAFASTGQGLTGTNMFAYCGNNPVNRVDPSGTFWLESALEEFMPLIEVVCSVFIYIKTAVIPLSDEEKKFIATVAGESIGNNSLEQQAVAHTIMNRYHEPRETWSSVSSVSDVLKPKWYNAVNGNQYNLCLDYLKNRDFSNKNYEQLILAVMPIYYGARHDFTGGAHFVFNINTVDGRYFQSTLDTQPNRYQKLGPFPGVDEYAFCLYRCLW